MGTTSYFGRPEDGARRLGTDFDLLAKWSRTFRLREPVHSYFLTQLSDEDRAKLFSGPAEEFKLEEGPDKIVKLQTVKDEVDRIDAEVQVMMRSAGYMRSEARRLEILDAIEDARDEANGAAALALSKHLMEGMDGPLAEELAEKVAKEVLDSAKAQVRARWLAARLDRLSRMVTESNELTDSIDACGVTSEGMKLKTADSSPVGAEYLARCHATFQERFPYIRLPDYVLASSDAPTMEAEDGQLSEGQTKAQRETIRGSHFHFADLSDQTTPQPKPVANFTSPNESLPEYGSETSAGSAQWDSPNCFSSEDPSSPDVDSAAGFPDFPDGGVALLPSCLMLDLGLTDESDMATPRPHSWHLGAGLSQAFSAISTGFGSISVHNDLFDPSRIVANAAVADPFATPASQQVETAANASLAPLSRSETCRRPVAQQQPWAGFPRYEVPLNFSSDRLVPKYWTTKQGKERYLRQKLGYLKLDDAKLRSNPALGSIARNPVHIFVDLSNIVIGFYDSMKESRGIPASKRVMAPAFSFRNFDTILTRDRNVAKRIVAGSMSNSYNKRWPGYMVQAQELKYEMNILERVPKPASPQRKRKPKASNREADSATSGPDTSDNDSPLGPMKNGEQGVDELLHLKILQSAMDTLEPATMVLATGDAASAQYSDGFKKNVERVLAIGWNIELYGWRRNMSSAWRDPKFVDTYGGRFKIIELDEFCEELFDMTIESLEH
ncbi:uncharacterized protein B0T15DRAFT_434538 [Chaetomium strumarium]|uniref:Uncharacterized protein n=1 Tax=Chaetomium strumarium TaxID=1170767 RepID=A0AAJ0GTB9_9PEZI|nr:hypothetical protein B0T15DRAFT_434538 [Chaetomium strumarium]